MRPVNKMQKHSSRKGHVQSRAKVYPQVATTQGVLVCLQSCFRGRTPTRLPCWCHLVTCGRLFLEEVEKSLLGPGPPRGNAPAMALLEGWGHATSQPSGCRAGPVIARQGAGGLPRRPAEGGACDLQPGSARGVPEDPVIARQAQSRPRELAHCLPGAPADSVP